jgi:CBS domain-containing protein
MEVRQIMTAAVVTADEGRRVVDVAALMRDRGVGSVVICDAKGGPAAMITDRDVAIRVVAEGRSLDEPVGPHASRPLITGEPEMDLEEAAALMMQHRVRRLPVLKGGRLAGIVSLDDIAVRTGNLEVAQRMTADVIQGALPDFYFHERD